MKNALVPYSKPKLPKHLSFPIGAELITASLRDIPQLESVHLVFSDDPILSAARFREIIEADEPHLVLSARFERWDKKPSLGDDPWLQEYLHGRWSLWVYPVRRQLKAKARVVLLNLGLPTAAEWFSAERPSSWYWGRKRCDLVFVPAEAALRVEVSTEAS